MGDKYLLKFDTVSLIHTAISLFGFIGNITTCTIVYRKTNFLKLIIAGLAVADVICCLELTIFYVPYIIQNTWTLGEFFCRFASFAAEMHKTFSLLIVILTLNSIFLFLTCDPIESKHARYALIFSGLIAFVVALFKSCETELLWPSIQPGIIKYYPDPPDDYDRQLICFRYRDNNERFDNTTNEYLVAQIFANIAIPTTLIIAGLVIRYMDKSNADSAKSTPNVLLVAVMNIHAILSKSTVVQLSRISFSAGHKTLTLVSRPFVYAMDNHSWKDFFNFFSKNRCEESSDVVELDSVLSDDNLPALSY